MLGRHFPSTRTAAKLAAMTAPRTADLALRGPHGRLRATVQWPTVPGPHTPLVFFSGSWVGAADGELAETLCDAICTAGVISLRMRSREARGYESAVADATSAIEWVADHAAELDADPARLIVGGDGDAATAVAQAARRLREAGWPPITHLILIDPPKPRAAAAADIVAAGSNGARQLTTQGEPS
jgi:acetyl esterase